MVADFNNPEEYYSSLYHELIHWTSHKSRLNRQVNYAFEELVAEIGSAYLCGMSGIGQKIDDNQAAYIYSWLKESTTRSDYLVKAALYAQRAVDYLVLIDAR